MLKYCHRVVRMREVLQNGMSFANERKFLRCLYASAIIFCAFALIVIGLSKNFWEIFLCLFLRVFFVRLYWTDNLKTEKLPI